MRRKLTSVFTALLIAGGATLWILSGQDGQAEDKAQAIQSVSEQAEEKALREVRVRPYRAETREITLVVTGRTQASRTVTLRAETEGRIRKVHKERGNRVSANDRIASIRLDARRARLAEQEALLAQQQLEYDAAEVLNQKGYRAETQLAQAKAALDAAKASLQALQIDIEKTEIAAPFDGVLETRPVELGDFLREGDTVGTIVDLDPIVVAVDVAEKQIGNLTVGQVGTATLVTGAEIDGVIRFISSSANPATRTFRVELESPNPDHAIAEGLTAELDLPLETKLAHRLSPGLLSLNEGGELGLRAVDADDRVVFYEVEIIDGDEKMIWVTGLPANVRLITVGQEFVNDGDRVVPRLDESSVGS